MNKFLTILLLCNIFLAIVEENQASPNTIESQKTSLTITPDNGPAIKINTDSLNRFSRRNVVTSGFGQSSNSPFTRSTHDEENIEEKKPELQEEEAEAQLEEASSLLGTLYRLRRQNPGDTVEVDGETFDQIIGVLESYEDTLTEIIEEVGSESSTETSSQSKKNGNEDSRRRNLRGSHHAHQEYSKSNRSGYRGSNNRWVVKPW